MKIDRAPRWSEDRVTTAKNAIADNGEARAGMARRDSSSLAGSHDLCLSTWGPYTKRYMGISHIPDIRAGLRFDLSVFPEHYRTDVKVPSVKWVSGYHPWEAAPDLSYYSHRHKLIWKDRLFCDIGFCRLDEGAVLVRCACVNRTDCPQNLPLHYIAWLNFPPVRTYSDDVLRMCEVELPETGRWVDGIDYEQLRYAIDDPRANLTEDGQLRGEVIDHGFVGGQGLGQGFGREDGDSVVYRLSAPCDFEDARLLLRYRVADGKSIQLVISGAVNELVELVGHDGFSLHFLRAGFVQRGDVGLTITSLGGSQVEIDGVALVSADQAQEVRFRELNWNSEPERIAGPRESSLVLRFEHVKPVYGLAWEDTPFRLREFFGDDLDEMMRRTVNQHPQALFFGQGQGHYTDVFLNPVFMRARSERVFYGLACTGTVEEVQERLADFDPDSPIWDGIYKRARQGTPLRGPNSAGQGYRFSQERMAATVSTNVVYPIRTRGGWIRHNTPGRWWDCLYTWDAGFIGLGLSELDVDRAVDCLNAYLTGPDEPDAAFIHHGSPLPVQHYLFLELWNRTQSDDLLARFYPRLRRYHRFLSGRLGSSTTRTPLNLIRTWDYFYNSGGWDDYPAQKHVHQQQLEALATPVVNTSHSIRTAKILKMAALASGVPGYLQDVVEYDEDIALFTDALQTYAWDEPSGYFGYVCNTEDGRPSGILRQASGQNFNMGLDGISPLIAGICTPGQEARLLAHMGSDQHLWTPWGLTTVDQSAAYYRPDGYWNGAVWMPHQWFIWKALLDMGRTDEAHRIARTALDLWKREVEASYNCFEHFMVETGRGAGWHQFGGLSSPVLSWYSAYHLPGRLSTGLDVWVDSLEISEDRKSLSADLKLFGPSHHTPAVIAVMDEHSRYAVRWNGRAVQFHERYPGVLETHAPTSGRASAQLRIYPL